MRPILRQLIKAARDYSSSDEEAIVAKDPRLQRRVPRVVPKEYILKKVDGGFMRPLSRIPYTARWLEIQQNRENSSKSEKLSDSAKSANSEKTSNSAKSTNSEKSSNATRRAEREARREARLRCIIQEEFEKYLK